MFRRILCALLLPGALLMFAPAAWAHAVIVKDLPAGEARAAAFSYTTGEVAPFAAIKIFGPGDDKVEFQNGRTDERGIFAFIPDRPGTWTMVMTDGMGHKATHPVQVAPFNAAAAPQESDRLENTSMLLRALLGCSLLLNIFAGAAALRRRGNGRHAHK